MTLTCGAVRPRLTALLDGELPPDEAASVEAHLTTCTYCAAVRDSYAATLRAAETFPVETADIADTVLARILAETPATVPVPAGAAARGSLPPFVERLERRGRIPAAQLEEALSMQRASGGDLADILIDSGIPRVDVYAAKAEADGLPFIDLNRHKPEAVALGVVPEQLARRHKALPVRKDGQVLFVAMENPRDTAATDEIRMVSRCIVRAMAAVPDVLREMLDAAYQPKVPAAPAADPLSPETHLLLGEIRTLRAEMEAMRGEMDGLRRQIAAARAASRVPPRPASPRLFPFAPPTDLPGRNA
jgi:hypothetical protein